MNMRIVLGLAGLTGGAIVLGQVAAGFEPDRASDLGQRNSQGRVVGQPVAEELGINSDVIVGELHNHSDYGTSGGKRAYSIGTTSCNIGTDPLAWVSSTNQHPVIAQNMFRFKDGRFEHIGQSWLKHGFFALAGGACNDMNLPVPCNGQSGSALQPGCSDPYDSGLNGSQGSAGPKSEVNATTGFFPYPPNLDPPWSGSVARRLQVDVDDVTASMNPGARFFVEGQYIHPIDNAISGSSLNNASWREVDLDANGAIDGFIGGTVRMEMGLYAWQSIDPNVKITKVSSAGDGRMNVGSIAYDNGDGTWDYEYAVHNLDSDRGAAGFAVPIPPGVSLTNIGFHDVDYHSGEPWDGTDWSHTISGGEILWSTQTEAQNPDANAIRWGTLYNFRFTADTAPVGQLQGGRVDYFKAGGSPDATVLVFAPQEGVVTACDEDFTGDNFVGTADLTLMLNNWGTCPTMGACPWDLDDGTTSGTPDGFVGVADLTWLLNRWGDC